MSNNVIPDEKTVKSIKNSLIIVCVTLTILIGLMIIVILAKKTVKVADETKFDKVLTESGCTVTNETTRYSNVAYVIISAFLAKSSEGTFSFRYVKLYDQDYTSQFFNLTKKSYEKQKTKSNVVSESFNDDDNKGEYVLTTKKTYTRIERLGNIMIEANGYPQYRKEIDDLFKKLGF